MKLATKYNRHIYPAVFILILACITCSFFLTKQVLQRELDSILLRSKGRIEEYTLKYKKLPAIFSFDDQHITFTKISQPLHADSFKTCTVYIPEQNKNHVARQLIFGLEAGNEHYEVTISQPLEGTRHLTILIVEIAVATTFLVAAVLIIINWRVISRTWRPFYQSLQRMDAFRVHGKEKLVFPSTNIEEFNLMNQHFMLTAQKARIDYRHLKEFSENAAHETQTPLAIIRSNLDNLVQHENLTEKQTELIQSAYAAVSKLSKMQQALLLLTKIDNKQFDKNSRMDLSGKLRDKITEFSEFWVNKNIHIATEITESVIDTNSDLLEILLNNLFSNAIRHNSQSGIVNIECKQGCMSISNTGDDKPLDKERIFRRFYKASVNSEHNGLGLSIIKEICDSSGIEINYQFEKGLHQFILTWSIPGFDTDTMLNYVPAISIPEDYDYAII